MQWAKWKAELQERSKLVVRTCSDLAKRTKKMTSSYVMTHKKQVITAAAALLFTVTAGASAQIYYTSNINSIYHVIVNGQEIGVVDNPEVINSWKAAKLQEEKEKNGLTFTLADQITFREEQIFKGEFDNEAAVAALDQIADIKVQAVKLVVDGNVIGYAADEETAKQVLLDVKQKYSGVPVELLSATEPGLKNLTASAKKGAVEAASLAAPADSPVKEVAFKEKVEVQKATVTAAEVLSEEELENLIVKGTNKEIIHTVVEGDCIGCIAAQYGITSQDIYANNPGITEHTVLQLGQQINVTAMRPLVTVQVKENVTQQETIPFNTQINNNDTLPKGETKVVQEGKNGSKTVLYEVIKENGQVIERKVLNQDIIEEPVLKIIERGTKVIPSRGTGRLAWPARGTISSGFGMRWGKMHKGIDIAGSGSVMAADNGRVAFVGWDGGYGNAIIIDHGNGMKTLYGHLRSFNVKVGDVVQKGQQIGVKGSTGNSTGVHLHFEVIVNGTAQNPMRYLQ